MLLRCALSFFSTEACLASAAAPPRAPAQPALCPLLTTAAYSQQEPLQQQQQLASAPRRPASGRSGVAVSLQRLGALLLWFSRFVTPA